MPPSPPSTPAPFRAYHGDSILRMRTLARISRHAEADEIIQGRYWERGRGCAVGCLTHDERGGHALYPERWGIPVELAYLEDRIFEGLPADVAKRWPLRFLSAISCGVDLSLVWPRFALTILADSQRGVAGLTREGSAQRAAVEGVVALFRRQVAGEMVTLKEWRKASAAAGDAADAAAVHAAAYAADAAGAAADGAADAAVYAVGFAYADAGLSHYVWMADTLVALLKSAPPP